MDINEIDWLGTLRLAGIYACLIVVQLGCITRGVFRVAKALEDYNRRHL